MEKYIIVAHPIDFTRKALSLYLKSVGFIPYELEPDDDIEFKAMDMEPVALIIYDTFEHQDKSNSAIIDAFSTRTYEISGKIDPFKLVGQIKQEVETSRSLD